ncbi:MAG: hypothetical protein QNJ31_01780 [Candidatus Caenarcaniphilales bacterium]|nr:hypothetical protein [Candidatus Caenarcaniphilales bacterium]
MKIPQTSLISTRYPANRYGSVNSQTKRVLHSANTASSYRAPHTIEARPSFKEFWSNILETIGNTIKSATGWHSLIVRD